MSIITLLIVGLVAGWIAGLVMKGEGYGVIGDIIIGIIGAVIGGWLFSLLGVGTGFGIIGSIIVAAIGAIILVFVVHQIKGAT
jgi:uncharacterized membrane protein YeaQ/YmgE (transglycosylase-associated protein family)